MDDRHDRRGRRPLREGERTQSFPLRLSTSDLDALKAAAKRAGVSAAEYVRRSALAQAKRDAKKATSPS